MYLQHEKDVYNAAVARMTIDPIKNLMINRDRKVFFVGAGVSKDWPSCCFTGLELSCVIVESCVTDLPSFEKYTRVITKIIKYNQKASRLEVLLDIARQGIGKEIFQIFRIFEKSKPNLNHFFLAGAICEGYIVVTTNFDNLIEEAYKQIAPGKPLNLILYEKDFNRWLNTNRNEPALFKLHGTILDLDYRRKIDTIAATLNSLSSGLSQPKRKILKYLLENHDFVFLGYSGNDDFDIYPVLYEIKSRKTMLWVVHSNSSPRIFNPKKRKQSCLTVPDHINRLLFNKTNGIAVVGKTIDIIRGFPFYPKYEKIYSSYEEKLGQHVVSWNLLESRKKTASLVNNFSLSQRIRFVAKVLQYNNKLKLTRECFIKNIKVTVGLEKAFAYDDLAQCLYLMKDLHGDRKYRKLAQKKASSYYRNSLEAKILVAQTWMGLGENYRNSYRYEKSKEHYSKAMSIYKKLKIFDKVGLCLMGIAGIYRMKGWFKKSLKLYKQAKKWLKRGQDFNGIWYSAWGEAEIFKSLGDLDQAELLYKRIQSECLKTGNDNLLAWAYYGEAEIKKLQWKIAEGSKLYRKAYKIFYRSTNLTGTAWSLEGRFECINICEKKISKGALEKVENIFIQLNAKIGIVMMNIAKANQLRARGFPKQSLSILSKINLSELPIKERAHVILTKAEILRRNNIIAPDLYDEVIRMYSRISCDWSVALALLLKATVALSCNKNNQYLHSLAKAKEICVGRKYDFNLKFINDLEVRNIPEIVPNYC